MYLFGEWEAKKSQGKMVFSMQRSWHGQARLSYWTSAIFRLYEK